MPLKEIRLDSAEDLRKFMFLAMQSAEEIGVHTVDGSIADAKSVLGLMSLDYSKPVKVVTEDPVFLRALDKFIIGK